MPTAATSYRPYCTAPQYLLRFGAAEATMLLQDEERTLEEPWLRAIVHEQSDVLAELSADELAATDAALARLNQGLRSCALYIDGYLRRGAVLLPLTDAQREQTDLETCNAELTRCWLMDDADNATEIAEKRCDKQRKWLTDISTRKVQLFPDQSTASASVGLTRHGIGRSGLDWENYP